MNLVSAMCPNCGAKLELDENMEKGFCMYCGSQIIVQDAVQKYKIEISGKVSVEGILSAEDLAKNGETLINIGNFQQAYDTFEELSVKYPDDYRGWWGMIRAVTVDFTVMPEKENYRNEMRVAAEEYYGYVLKTVGNERKTEISDTYVKWDGEYGKKQHIFELEAEYGECAAAHSDAKGSQIFGGFASVGMFLLVVFLIAVSVILTLIEISLIREVFTAESVFNRIVCGAIAAVLFAPALKLLIFTFIGKLPEFIGVISATRESARIRAETKERMKEIDSEYSDISNER